MKHLRPCLVITSFLLVLCCVAYPALVTGSAQLVFPYQADGSLIEHDGKVRGSALLGQTFDKPETHPEYFWGRPSAATVDSASGLVYSSGSNYGPLNPSLQDEVHARVSALASGGVTPPVPVDLVTKSASGLDPHISPAAADIQAPRVAQARNMPIAEIRGLIEQVTEGRTFGFLGEPRVNVLNLNLALDERARR